MKFVRLRKQTKTKTQNESLKLQFFLKNYTSKPFLNLFDSNFTPAIHKIGTPVRCVDRNLTFLFIGSLGRKILSLRTETIQTELFRNPSKI